MGQDLDVPIQVECYAGYKGEEVPLALIREGERFQVVEIIERWCEEQGEPGQGRRFWFRVRVEDGRLLTLYRDEPLDLWFLRFSSEARP